jgi:hypothetical protein
MYPFIVIHSIRLAALSAILVLLLSETHQIDAFEIMKRTTTPHRKHATEIGMASFQEARLAEQLRFRISSEGKRQEESAAAAAASAAEEARNLLALEEQLIDDGKFIPEAPMMTYQKYLTMQEKRVKVTIRYSASAGLRPFYLTVADQIKSYHPDVLLERRILPKVGSDAGGGEAVFEVLVDGKIVIGKKKTMFLKVSSKSSSSSDKGETDDNDKRSDKNNQSGEINFAGGRSIFVSMEKLEQELVKARKKRRPSTMYKNKEDALRGSTSGGGDGDGIVVAASGAESGTTQQQLETAQRGQAMTDAILRLEKLKAMSANKRKL